MGLAPVAALGWPPTVPPATPGPPHSSWTSENM